MQHYDHHSINLSKGRLILLILAASLNIRTTRAQGQSGLRGRRHYQSEACILTKVDVQMVDHTTREYWQCELQSSDVEQTGTLFVDIEDLGGLNLDTEAISGHTTVLVEGAVITDGVLSAPAGSKRQFGKIDKRGPAEAKKKGRGSSGSSGVGGGIGVRNLAPVVSDSRTVLAVRIKATDSTTTASLDTLRGDIFGIGRSTTDVNLKERFQSCSYNQTLINPFTGKANSSYVVANGVAEVEISISVTGQSDTMVKDAATAALKTLLGLADLSTAFDHVMLCLPPGTTGGWIAYGYLNSWLTVYNNEWCQYPSLQVHEIGHNLGLNHAGEGTDEYGDQTGLMGYSYGSFTTAMCYNNAKSWQLGWYGLKNETLDFSKRGGFNGTLVGVNDYQNAAATGKYVVVKIVGGTAGDLFVGFNRQTGINSDTQEAFDQVTVQRQVGTGKSSLLAKLNSGEQFNVTNFQGTKSLIIKATTIKVSQTPSFADIMIYIDGCPPGQYGGDCNWYQVIPVQTFEKNLGVFQVGKNVKINTKVFMKALGSNGSVQITGNSTTLSQMQTAGTYFVGNHLELRVGFWYQSLSTAAGDSFNVQISSDNGQSWNIVRQYSRNTDWTSDSIWYNGTVSFAKPAGSQWIKLRIATSIKSKGALYFENVGLDGR